MAQFNNVSRQRINRVRDLFQMQWSRKSFKLKPKDARYGHSKQKPNKQTNKEKNRKIKCRDSKAATRLA